MTTQDPGFDFPDNGVSDNLLNVGQEGPVALNRGYLTQGQFDMICFVTTCITIACNILGVLSNCLNIAVFVKLGFSESSNISLFALALGDLATNILSIWVCLCLMPPFRDANLPFNPLSVVAFTGGGLYTFLIRCTAWITAFISFERCLCVLVPHKVKRLITPRVTVIAVSVISVITVGPHIVAYWAWHFVWRESPRYNRTVLVVIKKYNAGEEIADMISRIICGVIQTVLAFVIVLACTTFLIYSLRRSARWRLSAATPAAATDNKLSRRDSRVVKMVSVIAVIFIACFTPNTVWMLCTIIFEEFRLSGRYVYAYYTAYLISSLVQSVGASVNIFIYYKMASKFRVILRRLLWLERQ